MPDREKVIKGIQESSVPQKNVADIMNAINDALEGTEFEAVGYDNTGVWLQVIIDRR